MQQAPSLAMAVSMQDQSKQLVQATRAFLEAAPAQDRGFFTQKLLGDLNTSTLKDIRLWSRKISQARQSPQVPVPRDKQHPFWKHPRPRNTRHKVPIEERDDIGCFVQEHLVLFLLYVGLFCLALFSSVLLCFALFCSVLLCFVYTVCC
jgi:hypothetical protein